ncbi:MAG: K(+)-transporting ATPase subunit F [Isosphaeraceae bacterium]|nr:K(+)-transporting ATPase subunit F [Isosphaeraceae bacterium]
MTAIHWIACGAVLGLAAYLVVALFAPERFS